MLDPAELSALEPVKKGGAWEDLWRLFLHTSLLRYPAQDHLKACHPTAFKVATKKKLQILCDLGYLRLVKNPTPIFTATIKTLETLVNLGYKRKLLSGPAEGDGAESYIAGHLAGVISRPDFGWILYPRFPKDDPYLIPDACLILKEAKRYQINFLEFEQPKTYWEKHLEGKRQNYLRLAKDKQVYLWWKYYSKELDLPCPAIEDFKFRVVIIGQLEPKNWGEGFSWAEKL